MNKIGSTLVSIIIILLVIGYSAIWFKIGMLDRFVDDHLEVTKRIVSNDLELAKIVLDHEKRLVNLNERIFTLERPLE